MTLFPRVRGLAGRFPQPGQTAYAGDRLGRSARLLGGSGDAIAPGHGHGLGVVGAEHSLLADLVVVASLRHLMGDRVAGGQRIGVLSAQDPGSGNKDSTVLGFGADMIASLRHLMSDRVAGGQRIGVLSAQDPRSGIKDSAVLGFGSRGNPAAAALVDLHRRRAALAHVAVRPQVQLGIGAGQRVQRQRCEQRPARRVTVRPARTGSGAAPRSSAHVIG